MNYETTGEIKVAIARMFGVRQNLIVPNISWGLGLHECDLLILTKCNYAVEIEIKVDKYDLKKDVEKTHGHRSDKIKRLYFAFPQKLNCEEINSYIPERAGIIVVDKNGCCDIIKNATSNKDARKFTADERQKLAELGCMRVWNYIYALHAYNKTT